MDKFVLLAILACSAISVMHALSKDLQLPKTRFLTRFFLGMMNATGVWTSCGGSLISPRWVLTAAHCLRNRVRVDVRLGSVDSIKPLILISNITTFSFHNITDNNQNDVGVVDLGRDVPLSASIKPIRLPRRSQANDLFVDQNATLSGWGLTEDHGPVSRMLNFVQLKVITNQRCMEHFGGIITDIIICANGIESLAQGSCFGDSGGPLSIREDDGLETHIGITSFVSYKGCAADFPSGFARTTKFLDWISNETGIPVRP